MSWWRQTLGALALVAVAVAGWAAYLPPDSPWRARLGLSAGTPGTPVGSSTEGAGGTVITVLASPAAVSDASARISALGDGRALHRVSVTPLVSGRLTGIAVKSGDRVAPGDVIASLDAEAEEIALARAELAVAEAEATLARVEQLHAQGAATDVARREARLAARTAGLEVRDARLALDRRTVTAPIGGIIGLLPEEPGDQVSPASEIATIDDRSRILVDFRVPERAAGRLRVGDRVAATALARPELPLQGEVVALDSRVDPASRTLRIQAALENPGDALRGGMAFAIDLAFPGEAFPTVDPLAIQWGGDGAFVWAVREGKAARVPVRIVQRNSDTVLVAGPLAPGEPVITEGIERLRQGSRVRIAGEGAAEPVAAAPAPPAGRTP